MVMFCDPLGEQAEGTDPWSLSYERRNPEPCCTICADAAYLTQAYESSYCTSTLTARLGTQSSQPSVHSFPEYSDRALLHML